MQRRDPNRESGFPEARPRRTRWPGWVWIVPAAALIFAGWLAGEEWLWGPRPVTVRFADAEGVKPGAPVRLKGVQVGRVKEIRLADRLAEGLGPVELGLDMQDVMDGQLGAGTRFWIVRPGLGSGQITNLISGAYVAVDPEPGEQVDEHVGLEAPPVVAPDAPGRVFVLTAEEAEGLSSGAPVQFRGVQVGRVLGVRLTDGGVELPVFLREEHAELVGAATVFWRAGGLDLSRGASGFAIDLPSLGAIASGAVAFSTPDVLAGEAAEPGAMFTLYPSRDEAAAAATGPRFAYALMLAQPVGDLAPGAPVTLSGQPVGRVAAVRLRLAPDGTAVSTPVGIVLDAAAFGLDVEGMDTREAVRERLEGTVAKLVEAGLRARLAEGGIVFQGPSIELVMQGDAAPAQLGRAGEFPVIPTTGG